MAEKTDMNKSISKVLVSEEQLRARVAEMGAQLSEDYELSLIHIFSPLLCIKIGPPRIAEHVSRPGHDHIVEPCRAMREDGRACLIKADADADVVALCLLYTSRCV